MTFFFSLPVLPFSSTFLAWRKRCAKGNRYSIKVYQCSNAITRADFVVIVVCVAEWMEGVFFLCECVCLCMLGVFSEVEGVGNQCSRNAQRQFFSTWRRCCCSSVPSVKPNLNVAVCSGVVFFFFGFLLCQLNCCYFLESTLRVDTFTLLSAAEVLPIYCVHREMQSLHISFCLHLNVTSLNRSNGLSKFNFRRSSK